MPSMMSGPPILPLPSPGVLAIPPIIAAPRMPAEAPRTPEEAPDNEPQGIGPGPWCFGADALCDWLGESRLFGIAGPRSRTVCRVVMNTLCLLVGLLLLVAVTAVLIAAFLQPG